MNLVGAERAVAERMQAQLREHVRNRGARRQMALDESSVEELRSLGYIQ